MSENVQVLNCQSLGMVRCPRCQHYHENIDNFGHEPEFLIELNNKFNTELPPEELKRIKTTLKEKLCNECVKLLLEYYPNHKSIGYIKENLRNRNIDLTDFIN